MKKKTIKLLYKQIYFFGFFIPISNLILSYGSKLIPRSIYQQIARKKHKKVESFLTGKLSATINQWSKVESISSFEEKAPIWYCWLQGEQELPAVVDLCYKSLKKNANGHPIYFITLENYKKYVTIPDFIENLYFEGKIFPAHFSDILRVALLYKHGGLWMDATLYLTKNISENIFQFSFYSIKNSEFGSFVSKCRWTVGFMAGYKNNPLFGAVFDLFCTYIKENPVQVDYLMMDYFIDILYQKNKQIKEQIDQVPYNNPNLYLLKRGLCKPFDQSEFNKITSDTEIIKLDWKGINEEDLNKNKSNYYHYLKSLVN